MAGKDGVLAVLQACRAASTLSPILKQPILQSSAKPRNLMNDVSRGLEDVMRILVYGDSNSWGYLDDGTGIRCVDRWPQVMARVMRQAGIKVELIEECLPGRTTTADDPREGPQFNGMTPFLPILLSHKPLDHVIIMLGTNDLKSRFHRNAAAIADGVMALTYVAAKTPCGRGSWTASETPNVTVICPPILGSRADNPDWDRYEEWLEGRSKSELLPDLLKSACAASAIGFIDGNLDATSSSLDPIHWDGNTHIQFGRAVAAKLPMQA